MLVPNASCFNIFFSLRVKIFCNWAVEQKEVVQVLSKLFENPENTQYNPLKIRLL